MRFRLLATLLLVACGASTPPPENGGSSHAAAGPAWNEWSQAAFERARQEQRPILLSVQAGWCHWCHVMNDTTYRDRGVLEKLEGFVMIRVDADARPDLMERYRRWGWPATVFLRPDGERILALRGFRDGPTFQRVLDEVSAAHRDGRALEETTEPRANADLDAVREGLLSQLDGMYDEEAGGWGRRQRYPFAEPVEHALYRATVRGEDTWRRRALFSLERYAALIDPVWGGMYQYSVGGVWDRPHFEKIVPVQAGALRTFAEAYRLTGDARWREHANAVRGYLREFLRSEDGAFYASQDADLGGHGQSGSSMPGDAFYALDDAGRRAMGAPRVDTHVYASMNGQLIEALALLSRATGERAPLSEATRAMARIHATHFDAETGLYRHDGSSADPLRYLADQAFVLRALVALEQVTQQASYRERAVALAAATRTHLEAADGGFYAHTEDPRSGGFFERRIPVAENAAMARGLMVLSRLAENDALVEVAANALRAAADPSELRSLGRMVGDFLLALEELEAGHVVLSVVGPDTPETQALFAAAQSFDDPRALVELGRPGASRYPYPGEPAVFLCSGEACSMPVSEPAALEAAARAFLASE
ncbi:MAG: thioredoxin domain-containing protein [Sandaracinaceae bacterium]